MEENYYFYLSAQVEFIDTKDQRATTLMNNVVQLESNLINKAQIINLHKYIAKKFMQAADKEIVKSVQRVTILSISCLGKMTEEIWNFEPKDKEKEEKPN